MSLYDFSLKEYKRNKPASCKYIACFIYASINQESSDLQASAYSYHVMYMSQNESIFYSCLNVKELLAQNSAIAEV